jgi:TonB family protein
MDDSPASRSHFLWQVPAKPVSVRLSLNVVDRLGAAVMEGFKAIPRRGLETGGLLLGSERRNGGGIVVEINDFEPLECEHVVGPSYLLSPADRRALEERIGWHKSGDGPAIVGFYRSHTRRDFALTVEDTDLMAAWFSRDSNVFLLLQSNGDAPPTAGFAIWEGRKIRSYVPYGKFEFARPSLMASGSIGGSRAPAPLAQSDDPEASAEAPNGWWSSLNMRMDWGWIAAAAIVIVTLLVGAMVRRDVRQPLASVPLGLSVKHDGGALRLLWNPNSSVVRSATRAELWIGDGGHQAKLDLNWTQLAGGSVVYWPQTGDVNFRLEVFSPYSHGSQSLRAVGAPRPTPTPAAVAEPPAPAPVAEPPAPAVLSTLVPPESPTGNPVDPALPQPDRVGDRDRGMDLPAENAATPARPLWTPAPVAPLPKAVPLPVPEAPSPKPPAPTATAALPAAVMLPERLPAADPLVRVEVEPATEARGSLLGRLVGRHPERAGFVPPSPAHRPSLAVPPNLRDRARREGVIDVRVYVDPAGKVEYAELETEASRVDPDLAALAVFSSRRWQFVPAHQGDRKVPGEVVLRYRFGTP